MSIPSLSVFFSPILCRTLSHNVNAARKHLHLPGAVSGLPARLWPRGGVQALLVPRAVMAPAGFGFSVRSVQKAQSSSGSKTNHRRFNRQPSTGTAAPTNASSTKWFAVAKIVISIAAGHSGARTRSTRWGENRNKQMQRKSAVPKWVEGIAATVSWKRLCVHAEPEVELDSASVLRTATQHINETVSGR